MKNRALQGTVASVLIATLVMLPRSAPAPMPIYLAIALKCVAAGTIGTTAIILYRCEPDYYLVRYKMDGEDTYWACSQASMRTLSKTGGARCEGPSKSREEFDLRAWANNHSPDNPMFPCGYAGQPLPNATWTNYTLVSPEISLNGGRRWISAGHALVEPGEANWSVALLGPDGTNGMTMAELRQVADCDLVVTNAIRSPRGTPQISTRAFVSEVPNGLIESLKEKISGS